jgi:hypothetical protein
VILRVDWIDYLVLDCWYKVCALYGDHAGTIPDRDRNPDALIIRITIV